MSQPKTREIVGTKAMLPPILTHGMGPEALAILEAPELPDRDPVRDHLLAMPASSVTDHLARMALVVKELEAHAKHQKALSEFHRHWRKRAEAKAERAREVLRAQLEGQKIPTISSRTNLAGVGISYRKPKESYMARKMAIVPRELLTLELRMKAQDLQILVAQAIQNEFDPKEVPDDLVAEIAETVIDRLVVEGLKDEGVQTTLRKKDVDDWVKAHGGEMPEGVDTEKGKPGVQIRVPNGLQFDWSHKERELPDDSPWGGEVSDGGGGKAQQDDGLDAPVGGDPA